MVTKYTHFELNTDIKAVAGYYTPQKEIRLKYNGREVLCVFGQAVVDSSCCGTSNHQYALIPGYIVRWQPETNENGLPVSEVEPITDKAAQFDIRKIVKETENVFLFDFW